MKIIRHFPSAHSVKQTPTRPNTWLEGGCQRSHLSVRGAEDAATGLQSWESAAKKGARRWGVEEKWGEM